MRRCASAAEMGVPASEGFERAADSNMSPALRFELWGIVTASQPGIAFTHFCSRWSHSSTALRVSTQLGSRRGTRWLRKITLRWRLIPSSSVAVHS